MKTLLLCFAGAMQSWGTQSRFGLRETGLEPSKSGVIGLLCAALGKPREERDGDGHPALAALAALRMGVRVDCPGVMLKDYQTTGGGILVNAILSRRFYLADAKFLIGLESQGTQDEKLLDRLHNAVQRPRWQLCLGRKAFIPSAPVWLSDNEQSKMPLEEALRAYEWLGNECDLLPGRLRLVIDTTPDDAEAEARMDVPVSFAARKFDVRYVKTDFINCPPSRGAGEEGNKG